MSPEHLVGKRILLVEDNFLVGTTICRMLESLGCLVLGPIAALEEANRMALEADVDAGVLDINIIGGTSASIADALRGRGRPFIFVTGYGSAEPLPEGLRDCKRLNKPIDERMLREALRLELA